MDFKISSNRVQKIFNKSKDNYIAVVGDVMLDKYVYGYVSRISPEAPVQIVDVKSTDYKLGGAANVANNVKTLGSEPILIGIVGDDMEGDIYLDTMKKQSLNTDGIFKDESRPTTSKTRVIAHSQHILRIDSEVKHYINGKLEDTILKFIKTNLENFESVILQDYNKGILSKEMIHKIISFCRGAKKPIFVDPKFDNFFEYKNVTVFKPNRKEMQDALGARIDGDDLAIELGKKLMKLINCEWLIITRGEKGMMMFDREKTGVVVHNIPTKAIRVADVSGAGDTVISTLAVAVSGGADIKEAIIIANHAAGLVCEEVGIVPIYKKNLIEAFKK
ncbi:MAG: D-glycero-beta-D-manno-heptose-7-phosphate kinase [Ignavibacteria bacterium]|jgi:rfaE bifunctional protein kinase chain/domain